MSDEQGCIKGWVGNLEILKHLDAHGVLDQASRDMEDEEEVESIAADDFMQQLRERYGTR